MAPLPVCNQEKSFCVSGCSSMSHFHVNSVGYAEVNTRKKTFAEVQTERSEQAERTVLIKCPPKLNEKKLLQYLSSHGNIESHFFFENRNFRKKIV
uniref:RL domain-containing protein n=1 Tax=Accipiter nisus TaxID=211598 RepID=A0A8B9MBW0_9AVES